MEEPTPDDVVQALRRALDDVFHQIAAMPVTELLGDEDLEWSFDGPDNWWLLVEAKRGNVTLGTLTVAMSATARSRFNSRVRAEQRRHRAPRSLSPRASLRHERMAAARGTSG